MFPSLFFLPNFVYLLVSVVKESGNCLQIVFSFFFKFNVKSYRRKNIFTVIKLSSAITCLYNLWGRPLKRLNDIERRKMSVLTSINFIALPAMFSTL